MLLIQVICLIKTEAVYQVIKPSRISMFQLNLIIPQLNHITENSYLN